MADFTIPEFLQNVDVDTIHQAMLDQLPEDIDKTEGGFVWDLTRPTAVIASELLEFYAPEIIKLIFPQWSYGEYLDLLAPAYQVTRKAANAASVVLKLTGVGGTAIPSGTLFCTEEDADVPSIVFSTNDPVTIGSGGTVTVHATAVEAGTASNVDAGTIILMSEPIKGVETITNEAAATGGTEEEDDDSLRERMQQSAENSDTSYIGNMSDFKRWAESVDGMGTAIVMMDWNGPETVKIICTDANGVAANDSILAAVYDKIMSPDTPINRLAPPNTILTVEAPEFVDITYSFSVVLTGDFTTDTVKESFEAKLDEYYKTVSTDGAVRYTSVAAMLSETEGVQDFKDLLINGSSSNIAVSMDQYPRTTSITATEISEV